MKLSLILLASSLFLIITLIVVPGQNFSKAQGSDPYSYSENSSPYDIPYKDWTGKWAAWLDSLPRTQNWNFQNTPGVKYKA
jgi:hypothetical protein